MQPESDVQLLAGYAERGDERAFTEIVARHANLVYSAALRQVNLPDIAAEVAQQVFIGLARGAQDLSRRLAPDAALVGWLYRSARNLSLNLRRDEFRRHSRERQAMEHPAPTPETAPDWEHLRPVLDEAMSDLSEPDYDALVMRFFKNQDLRSVGLALGLSDDAAQKRVSRALDKLRGLLSQRGIATSATALSTVLSANAVQAAPVGLALTISTTATLAGTTLATTATATAIKTIAMTTLQKTLITAAIVAAVGAGIYEARQASALRTQVQNLQQQQAPSTGQLQQLTRERDDATRQLAALREENERLNRNNAELFKLRGEVGVLRNAARDSKQVETDPVQIAAKSWLAKVNVLKKWVAQRPEQQIPEFQYLQDVHWLDEVKNSSMEGPYAPANAMGGLRYAAKRQFAHEMSNALRRFVEDHIGDLPADLSQLNPYFQQPMNDAILKSYKLLHSGKLADLPKKEWLVKEIAPPFDDQEDDRQMVIRTDDYLRVRREQ